jgi:hypothetical protein
MLIEPLLGTSLIQYALTHIFFLTTWYLKLLSRFDIQLAPLPTRTLVQEILSPCPEVRLL